MATNHNFRVKNGLEVAGTLIADSSGVLQLASGLTSSTQNAGTNNTTLATTAFVTAAITAIGDGHIDWTGAGAGTIHASNYTNTTYSVGDGGLSQISFTTADNAKLDAIEASATADQTAAEIRTAVEAATDSNVFTDADHTKLNAIEASATADQTGAEIKALYEAETNAYTNALNTKLAGIEALATADQTAAEIRTLVGSATDSNVFSDSDLSKLTAIEASATADQTNAEIRTAVEAATDSNVFTDADHTKLNAIEASADVTDTTNVVAALTAGTNVTISVGGTIASTDTTYTSSDFTHDNLTGFVANEHIDWTGSSAGTIHLTNLPATAITSVQTAVSQVAMLALTTEEGDVVVRSDESKTYMHNGGTAGTMADFTLLATPTDAVSSVDGATGVITLNHDNLAGFVANEHIDWSTDQGATNIHAGNYTNTTYSVGDGGLSQINFTSADNTKLDGIEASATADQTNAEIRAAVEAATDSNVFTDADHTKLNAIEASATADQTGAEIKALYEAETNAYTNALNTKLAGIEALANVNDATTVLDADIGSTVQAYDANLTSFVTALTLPTADGSVGQALVTDGSGSVTFAGVNATQLGSKAPANYDDRTLNALGSVTGTTDIDLADGTNVTATIAGATTFTISGITSGSVNTVTLRLTNAGAYTITWPSGTTFNRNTAPVLPASGDTIIVLETYDNATSFAGIQVWRSV